jgi:APA family basic amino acid/polyamine antiporter
MAPSAKDARLTLTAAVALVLGTIIGTGVFTLPAALAPYGTVSLAALVAVTLGAIALALLFGRLALRRAETGGPYVYAREAFGDFAGFLAAWSYWISGWAGNAAIVVAWVGYVDVFIPVLDSPWKAVLAAWTGLWLPALVNLSGLRRLGGFQVAFTIAKFVPLLLVAVFGLFFVKAENFGPFNATGGSVWAAFSAAGAVLLFSYIGVESASIAAGSVRDRRRNVGRATVTGTLAAAVVYLFGTVAVFGTVGVQRLADSTAPFADAVDVMAGGTTGGRLMALAAVFSGFGALIGWTLVTAEMSFAAARDDLFPQAFSRVRNGVPWVGVLVAATFASVLVVMNFTGGLRAAFTAMALLTGFTVTIPYLLSALAQIYWRRFGRPMDLVIACAAVVFAFWMIIGGGASTVYQGLLMLLLGLPLYAWRRGSRGGPAKGASNENVGGRA